MLSAVIRFHISRYINDIYAKCYDGIRVFYLHHNSEKMECCDGFSASFEIQEAMTFDMP